VFVNTNYLSMVLQHETQHIKHIKYTNTESLGEIKASQAVVLNEDSVAVTQRKLRQRDPQIEFDFVEKHIH